MAGIPNHFSGPGGLERFQHLRDADPHIQNIFRQFSAIGDAAADAAHTLGKAFPEAATLTPDGIRESSLHDRGGAIDGGYVTGPSWSAPTATGRGIAEQIKLVQRKYGSNSSARQDAIDEQLRWQLNLDVDLIMEQLNKYSMPNGMDVKVFADHARAEVVFVVQHVSPATGTTYNDQQRVTQAQLEAQQDIAGFGYHVAVGLAHSIARQERYDVARMVHDRG